MEPTTAANVLLSFGNHVTETSGSRPANQQGDAFASALAVNAEAASVAEAGAAGSSEHAGQENLNRRQRDQQQDNTNGYRNQSGAGFYQPSGFVLMTADGAPMVFGGGSSSAKDFGEIHPDRKSTTPLITSPPPPPPDMLNDLGIG